MNNFSKSVLAMAAALGFCAGAQADNRGNADFWHPAPGKNDPFWHPAPSSSDPFWHPAPNNAVAQQHPVVRNPLWRKPVRAPRMRYHFRGQTFFVIAPPLYGSPWLFYPYAVGSPWGASYYVPGEPGYFLYYCANPAGFYPDVEDCP